MYVHDFSWNNAPEGLPPGAPLSLSLSLLPGLHPPALGDTGLKQRLPHPSFPSPFPSPRAFAGGGGDRGAGGALPAVAEPPAVGAGVGASHLRLFLEAGFVPHSICLGRKRLLLQKGAWLPEGRGFTPLLAPLRGRETFRKTAKCC